MTEGRTRRARPAAGRPTGRAAGPGVRPGSEVWRQRVDRERECVNRDCGLASERACERACLAYRCFGLPLQEAVPAAAAAAAPPLVGPPPLK